MPEPPPLDLDEYLAPIVGESPAGPSLRYEDDYAAIERAREEEEDAADEGRWKRPKKKADWDAVISLGLKMLKSKTKDLEIAGWVAEALARRRGLAGLRDGLRLVLAIQDAFWETAHPDSGDLELREGVYDFLDGPRQFPLMVRAAPLTEVIGLPPYSFLKYKESREVENLLLKPPIDGEDLEATFRTEGKPRAEEVDQAVDATDRAVLAATVDRLGECIEAVNQLNLSIKAPEHYGKKGRTLVKTVEALEEVARLVGQWLARKTAPDADSIEETLDEPEAPWPVDQVEDDGSGEALPTWESAPEPVFDRPTAPRTQSRAEARPAVGPIAGTDDARSRIVALARYLREADPAHPLPYLVVRALGMGELYRSSSPIDPSMLPPPAVEDRQALRRLATEGSWTELLDRAEAVLGRPEGTGWLDVRRFALKAIDELGLGNASRAVRAVLAAELWDYPEWPGSELDDGTPCASNETRAWIVETFPIASETDGSEVAKGFDNPVSLDRAVNSLDVDDRPEPARDPWDQAQDLLRQGQSREAIALVGRAAREATTGRDRFLRTFQQAEFCLLLGRPGVALPLLEGLARQIDEFQLDRWEDPQLCARVVASLYQCLRGKDDVRARAVYDRLCQLDIGQALGLGEDSDA